MAIQITDRREATARALAADGYRVALLARRSGREAYRRAGRVSSDRRASARRWLSP